MKLEFHRYIFEKCSNIIFFLKSVEWEASSSTRTDGETDVTKLIVDFQNFTNPPKKCGMLREKNICIEIIFEI